MRFRVNPYALSRETSVRREIPSLSAAFDWFQSHASSAARSCAASGSLSSAWVMRALTCNGGTDDRVLAGPLLGGGGTERGGLVESAASADP